MDPNYKIRPATLADCESVCHFIGHLEEKSFDFESFAERYKSNLGKSETIYLVSVNDIDEVTGFIGCQGQSILHREGKTYAIQEVYVARPYRGKGIGRALLQALEEKLQKTKAESLEVSTPVKRPEVRRFYSRFGFVQADIHMVKAI